MSSLSKLLDQLKKAAEKWLKENTPVTPSPPTDPTNPPAPNPPGGIVSDKILGLMMTDLLADPELENRRSDLLKFRAKYNTILSLLDLQKNGAIPSRPYVEWARNQTSLTALGEKNIKFLHSLGFKVHVILLNAWGAKHNFCDQMGSVQQSLPNEAALYSNTQLDRERAFVEDLLNKCGNEIDGILPLLEATQSGAANFGMKVAESIRSQGFKGKIIFNHISDARTELNKHNYKALGVLIASSLNSAAQWRSSTNDIKNTDGMNELTENNTALISEFTGGGGPFGFYIWAANLIGSKSGRSVYSENWVKYSKATGTSVPNPNPPPTPPPSSETPKQRMARLYPGLAEGGGNDGKTTSNSTIWKPKSDSDGKLVVVVGYSFPQITSVEIRKGGTLLDSLKKATNFGNGYRSNFRFPKGGPSYGSGLTLVVKTVEGDYSASIPNGGNRYDPVKFNKGVPPVVPPPNPNPNPPPPEPGMKTYFLESADGKSLTLRADLAAKIRYVDALTTINDPHVRGGTPPGSSIRITPSRSGNTWTLPQSIYSYKTGNVPNAWRMAFVPPPPSDVKWHTSINQGFVVNNKPYPPTTRK